MRWNEIVLSDDTQINVTSIAFGNGYYTALSVRFVNDEYHIDILYTDDLANEWNTKTIYNSGADPVIVPGIIFTSRTMKAYRLMSRKMNDGELLGYL